MEQNFLSRVPLSDLTLCKDLPEVIALLGFLPIPASPPSPCQSSLLRSTALISNLYTTLFLQVFLGISSQNNTHGFSYTQLRLLLASDPCIQLTQQCFCISQWGPKADMPKTELTVFPLSQSLPVFPNSVSPTHCHSQVLHKEES